MPLSRSVELIKKMSSEPMGDPKASITEKQTKLLYRISKLKQLMNNAIYALVKEVNGRRNPAFQEETEGKSSTLYIEGKTEIINNLITNSILEERLPTILKEI